MRIVLINPPYTAWTPRYRHLAPLLGSAAPLGLLALAAYARRHLPGLDFSVLDAQARSLSVEDCAPRAVAAKPDVVGLTVTTAAAGAAATIAAAIKSRLPGAYLVAGGPHYSGLGVEALRRASAFDAAVFGEGEIPFLDLLRSRFPGARPLDSPPPGVILRLPSGVLRAASERPAPLDMAAAPLPAWDLLPGFPGAYPPNLFFSAAEPAATLVTSRGCPFQCAFCDRSTFGRHYRGMTSQGVYGALEHLQRQYQVRYVNFYDDLFTANRRRVFEICAAIRSLPRPLHWSCDANVLTLDRELLAAMKSAGCWSIALGLESGAPEILRSLRKSDDLEKARAAVFSARAAGIRVKGLFICGTPEESAATAETTRRFIAALPLTTLNLSKFTPYPGTELYAAYAAEIDGRFDSLNGMNFVVPSRHLSIPQLEAEYKATIRSFYQRLGALKSHWPLFARPGNLGRLVRMGAAFLRSNGTFTGAS